MVGYVIHTFGNVLSHIVYHVVDQRDGNGSTPQGDIIKSVIEIVYDKVKTTNYSGADIKLRV